MNLTDREVFFASILTRTGEELPKVCPLPLSKTDYKFNVKAKTIVTLKFTCLGNRKDNVTGSLKLENKKKSKFEEKKKKHAAKNSGMKKGRCTFFFGLQKGRKLRWRLFFACFYCKKGHSSH